jgi:predicted 3-demethylubiquinone-9 3-methyltransferase (glyoxalase superfamily)
MTMSKRTLTTCLWFEGNTAAEAARYYCSIFKTAKLLDVGPLTAEFQIDGHDFVALNGNPTHKFNESISMQIFVDTQAELDDLWGKLLAGGGEESMCGWLKDKYGVSWQVIPSSLLSMIKDTDAARAQRTMQAMMKMRKLDIAVLEKAHRGE